ncbi:14619_t:CDS:10 [Acaulospora morrowiae]|uniref:14619_t:CDS:1 n=1 Tax=Acaulospora morrowiae TaxID=94023 RepID=A0A9N9C1H3_9GLOM|nr:14619_t:CDS:10 [Acaulospora morrowiae]
MLFGFYLLPCYFRTITLISLICYGTFGDASQTPHRSIVEPLSKIFEDEKYTESKVLDFLVIGDWGSIGGKHHKHGSQANVSKAMEHVATKYDSKFIINVGDNFYKRFGHDYQGVNSVDDDKWKEVWINVYNGPKLSKLTWYSIAGNHDWYTNVTAQVDYSLTKDSRWFMPSLFYSRVTTFEYTKDSTVVRTKIGWIHIDTNIFYYDMDEIATKREGLRANIYNFGWEGDDAIESKLKWIEQKLIDFTNYKWLFVVGHHPLAGQCAQIHKMPRLLQLFERYGVTAYFAGHNHVLQYKAPSKLSPVAHFISGAGSKTGTGCEGCDWGMPKGTFGFLHVTVGHDDKLEFEFVDATTLKNPGGDVLAGVILIATGYYLYGAESKVTHITSSTLSYNFAYALITIGGFISLVSFLGCYGAAEEKIGFLRAYLTLLFLLMTSQIVVGSLAFAYRQDADHILDQSWSKAFREEPQLLRDVENYFQCCGFNSIDDRVVQPCRYYNPCHEMLEDSLWYSLLAIGVVGVILGIMELLCLLLAVILLVHIRRNHHCGGLDEERQALLDETRRLDEEIREAYQRRRAHFV